MKGVRDEDTRRHRRAAARQLFDLEFLLRRIYIAFRCESPGDLSCSQFLDEGQWSLTGRAQPCRSRGSRFRCGKGRRHSQQQSAEFERCRTLVVGHEAKVPDADKTFREHMNQEPANKLFGGNSHRALYVSVSIVPPAERDGVAVEGEQSMIGDGDAMGIAAEVTQHLLGTTEGAV